MARKRLIDEQELMNATEQLLVEKGYEGFHFKALSEKLGTARSTIYEYYPNKDVLIATYMKKSMEMIITQVEELKKIKKAKEQLKKLMDIFISYSHLHHLLQVIHQLKMAKSDHIQKQIEELSNDHQKLFSLIVEMVERAQKENWVRHDISSYVIATIFFTSIQIPKVVEMDPGVWSQNLFSVIFDGIKME